MTNEVIYGEKPINPDASYVELRRKDDTKLDVDICYEGSHNVCHLILKNKNYYEPFRDALIQDLKDYGEEEGVMILINSVQAQDYHEQWVDYDMPAWDTNILVSMNEIDNYIEEVSSRLEYYCEGHTFGGTVMKYNIDLKQPLGKYSVDYWRGVMATLNWITCGDEKHNSEVY